MTREISRRPPVATPIPPGRPYRAPSPYLPGQAPLPPRARPIRHTPVVAPVLALAGLLVVGAASIWGITLLGFGAQGAQPAASLPAVIGDLPSADPDGALAVDPVDVEVTPPPDIVEPPPDQRADVKGTIVFGRDGDLWAASGKELTQLTNTASNAFDSAPAWSPDGRHIYYTHTTRREVKKGRSRPGGLYTFYVPDIMRVNADGSKRKRVYDSMIKGRGGLWFSHVLQPDVSPDGKRIVVVSDGSDGDGPVVLHTLSAKGGRLNKVSAPTRGDLGHNDPEYSPDGMRIAYTRNVAQGDLGRPVIAIHRCKSRKNCNAGKSKALRPGFANPSWSPDGTWLAVEATVGQGRDIALVNAQKGDVRFKLTDDGDSFAPVVSPNGDQVAYLHRDGLDIDLRIITLDVNADGTFTMLADQAVTQDGAIDGESPPAWYIPPEQRTNVVTPGDGGAPEDAAAAPAEEAALTVP